MDIKLDAAPKIVEPTIYELSSPGRIGVDFPDPDVPRAELPDSLLRAELPLPELSEVDVVRDYIKALHLQLQRGQRLLPPRLLYDEVQPEN